MPHRCQLVAALAPWLAEESQAHGLDAAFAFVMRCLTHHAPPAASAALATLSQLSFRVGVL